MATQDQAISMNCFRNKITKEDTDSKCQLFKHVETTEYLTKDGWGCSCPTYKTLKPRGILNAILYLWHVL
jgi:hypothetical protein